VTKAASIAACQILSVVYRHHQILWQNIQVQNSKHSTQVWYISYGSNMYSRRFNVYLRGGKIEGNSRTYVPAADPTPPRRSISVELPHYLYFAGQSPSWTGGAAHIGRDFGITLSRAYLITLEQFRHVVTQENWLKVPPQLPIAQAIANGHATIPEVTGRYDMIYYRGHHDGHPMFTFTAATPPTEYHPPAIAYLRTIIAGLREMHFSPNDIIEYLAQTPGIRGHYDRDQLSSVIS
jgi:hypothetical protein